ncbi:MAG: beta galactosidase jelly roll domain-containing protein [Bacteroidaceae bacterium]|nr:beta galactosidase jelly roll domain-containing protein [Bacteroidaceae bacterium]
MRRKLLFFSLLLLGTAAHAAVKLPSLLTDHMVVQRDVPIHLWGTADAGEQFIVQFKRKKYAVTADTNGQWSLHLPATKAGGPYEIRIADRVLTDVLVGDVWVCSGQSNVDVMISRVIDLYREEATTDSLYPVRLLKCQQRADYTRLHDEAPTDGWHILEPKFAWDFSALSYFMAKERFRRMGIPQGVVACSWGGTPIQAWMPADSSAWQTDRVQARLLALDEDYQAARRQTEAAYDRWWSGLLYTSDPGKAGNWQAVGTDESQWTPIDCRNNRWAQPGGGSWWFRQHVTVDAAHAGKATLLRCGTLVDADSTWVNGVFVGSTGYQYPPRRYPVPAGVLQEGDNVITVRITTGGARPEFIHPKPYCLDYDLSGESDQPGDRIRLGHQWLMRRGAVLPSRKDYGFRPQDIAGACYNRMLYPLHRLPISGVVWYQGESNIGEPHQYARLLTSLMGAWRSLWQKEIPYYIVQLPDHKAGDNWVALREAQRQAVLHTQGATLVTGLGLGEAADIHPLRKKEMAHRVVAEQLGEGSPRVLSAHREGQQVVMEFSTPLQGRYAQDFAISTDGRTFLATSARIDGKRVIADCLSGTPVAVRYAWADVPDHPLLMGTNEMPVATFQIPIQP